MSFPLYAHDVFGFPTGLVMAVLIGFVFGFALERGGFGRAPVLAAQFYFTNNRVLKVLFTAIATASVGLALLSGLGVIDLSMVTVPATYIGPQLVGGFLLGVGFIIAGYCPGTSVVSAASGNYDGLVTYAGVGIGTLVFGWMWPWVESFYDSGSMGPVRIDQMLGVPFPVLAVAVLVIAMASFLGVEKLEAFLAGRAGGVAPDVDPRRRNRVFAGLGVAAAGGLVMMAFPGAPAQPAVAQKQVQKIEALELAEALVARPADYFVVDLRDPAKCKARRLPGAMCLPEDDPGGSFMATLPATRELVLYADQAMPELPAAARKFAGRVLCLDGGFRAFEAAVLEPPAVPEDPTPQAIAEYRMRSALHGRITGTAAPREVVRIIPKAVQAPVVRKGGGC